MMNGNIYELIYMYHAGDCNACDLMEIQMRSWMERWIREKCEVNFHLKQYRQELYQEALLGMYDAMENYREDRDAGFLTFLKVIFDRRMYNFIRTIKSDEVEVSIDECIFNDNGSREMTLKDVIEQKEGLDTPEYALHFTESYDALKEVIQNLKVKEREILYAWSECDTQIEAAEKLNMTVRAYGAKLRRIRVKIKKEYDKNEKMN